MILNMRIFLILNSNKLLLNLISGGTLVLDIYFGSSSRWWSDWGLMPFKAVEAIAALAFSPNIISYRVHLREPLRPLIKWAKFPHLFLCDFSWLNQLACTTFRISIRCSLYAALSKLTPSICLLGSTSVGLLCSPTPNRRPFIAWLWLELLKEWHVHNGLWRHLLLLNSGLAPKFVIVEWFMVIPQSGHILIYFKLLL